MTTQAEFWIEENGAVWRTARKPFECHGLGGTLPANQCDREVQPGERYLDTGEITDWPRTHRMCETCAAKPSDVERTGRETPGYSHACGYVD